MSEHKFKIGDWVEFDDKRFIVYLILIHDIDVVDKDGKTYSYPTKALTHLPDCTGWEWKDWRDEVDVGDGWRRLGTDEVPAMGDECRLKNNSDWNESRNWITGGKQSPDAIYRRRVEPKYRGFTMHEFKPHRDRWIRSLKNGIVGTIGSYGEHGVYAMDSHAFCSYEKLASDYVFDDTDAPCGMVVTE